MIAAAASGQTPEGEPISRQASSAHARHDGDYTEPLGSSAAGRPAGRRRRAGRRCASRPARTRAIAAGYSRCSSTRMRADERLGGVARLDRDGRLHDDWAGVELRRHEVHGHAGDVDAVLERLPLRVDARKRRQQRRVNVEDRAAETRRRTSGPSSRMNPARQTRRDAALANRLDERAIVGVARRDTSRCGKTSVSIPPSRARAKPGRVGAIRDHDRHARRAVVPPRSPRESRPDCCRARRSARRDFSQVGGRACFPQFLPLRGQASKQAALGIAPCLVDSPWSDQCRDDPRSAAPATFFHVINRSVRKTPLFPRPQDYREFLDLLREGLKRHPGPAARVLHHVESLASRRGSGRTRKRSQDCCTG